MLGVGVEMLFVVGALAGTRSIGGECERLVPRFCVDTLLLPAAALDEPELSARFEWTPDTLLLRAGADGVEAGVVRGAAGRDAGTAFSPFRSISARMSTHTNRSRGQSTRRLAPNVIHEANSPRREP